MSLERNSKLISRKFIQYLIPSIMMIFAMQFSSLLDGILIGNMISGEALAATSLVMPVLYIIQAPGFAIGIGGSIVIANKLGQRDMEGAKKAFSLSLIIGLAISLIFAGLSFVISSPIAMLFGEASYSYSYPFIFMYLLTDPIITLALLLGNFMAVDNNPKLSSIFFIASNVAKIGLEVLLIFLLNQSNNGMYGAALSTGAGFLVAFAVLPFYIKSNKRMLTFTFKVKNESVLNIFKSSSTSGINMILTAVQMFIVNIYIGILVTSPVDLLAFGLIANVVFVFDLFCGGILNVIPNIISILYGEKDYYSLKTLTRKIFWINIIVTVVLSAFILIFPNVYCFLFGYSDSANMDYVSMLIRVYLIAFIPYSINKFSMNYYPSIEKNLPSLVVVLLREFVIVLPVTLALLFTNGILGYSIAYVITEALTVVLTYIFIFFWNKKTKTHGIFMFEEGDNIKTFDTTLENQLENASLISEQLTKFARSNGVAERESQIVGLTAEEIVNNIITYGYKHNQKNYIDVGLKIIDDLLVLRIRDDGLPFDPTKYEFDHDENYSTSGIELISKLTDKMNYMRVLSMNNTTFEIRLHPEQ
ncbi:MAG: ATP-binding protein [Bacilli bacterium]|nr:ATP-binding protein [Bacilli bacterium]